MPKVHVGVLLSVAALLALSAPSDQRQVFTGHPPEPPPPPTPAPHSAQPAPSPPSPCHSSDGVLDCTGINLEVPAGGSKARAGVLLSIGGWNMSGFSEVVLDGNPGLHELHQLLSVPRDPSSLPALPASPGVRSVSLKYHGLASIASGAFVGLPDLTTLDLSHNQLTADAVRADVLRGPWRADSYEPLPLETLDLSYNALHALLHRALEHLVKLRTLRLDGNPLRVLDKGTQTALAGATTLQVLGLSSCGFSALPADLSSGLPRGLLTLDLSRNLLLTVHGDLPPSLHRLVLDGNPIRTLPSGDSLVPPFLHLDNLEELSLSYMPHLEDIKAGAFFGLPRLRALSCSHNPVLRSVDPAAFSHMGPSWTLTEVSLKNNSLTYLHPGLFGWRGLTFMDLSDNPWHCSCNFTTWATATLKSVNINLRDNLRCTSPPELAGRPLLNSTQLACSPALREPVVLGRPSLFANALVLVLTASLVASVVLLARRLLSGDSPGRLLGKAARVPRRVDSMKTPLYVAVRSEDESVTPRARPTDVPYVGPGGPGHSAAVFVDLRRGDL